jgi:hypothetical protein
MSRPNVHGLPQFLRKDERGISWITFIREGGLKKRKRVRLGRNTGDPGQEDTGPTHARNGGGKVPGRGKTGSHFQRGGGFLPGLFRSKKEKPQERYPDGRAAQGFFRKQAFEKLNAGFVEGFLTQRKKAGNQASNQGRNGKALIQLHPEPGPWHSQGIVNRAVFNDLIEKNPIQRVRPFREESRDRTLTPEEYQGALGALRAPAECHSPIGLLDGHEEGGDFGFAVGTGGLSKQGHQPGSRGHQDPGETGSSFDGGLVRPPETDAQDPWKPLCLHP